MATAQPCQIRALQRPYRIASPDIDGGAAGVFWVGIASGGGGSLAVEEGTEGGQAGADDGDADFDGGPNCCVSVGIWGILCQ